MSDIQTAGSKPLRRRFHGHSIVGPETALAAFAQLGSDQQSRYIREAQHYGVTKVVLADVAWELEQVPGQTFRFVPVGDRGFV